MSESEIAVRILYRLDAEIAPNISKSAKAVKKFIDILQKKIKRLRSNLSPLKGATILYSGSVYEGLAVDKNVDFDIIIGLGKPFVAENLLVQREPNQFFSMRWKPAVDHKGFADAEGYLDAAALRRQVLLELLVFLKFIRLDNVRITWEISHAAMIIYITLSTGLQFSIDLVPMIIFYSWEQCPHLKPVHEMPVAMKNYIETLISNGSPTYFFSLRVPCKPFSDDHRLCNISFQILEQRFVTSDAKVRSMVRLVKLMASRSGWKKYSFQPYFVKRIALKYYDSLNVMNVWNGYKAIMQFIWLELQNDTIDGYFIANQKTVLNPRGVQALREKIKVAITKNSREVEALLKASL